MAHAFANVIGFDDGPFDKRSKVPVSMVGVVYARDRLDGALIGEIDRDGDKATQVIAELVRSSRFDQHIRCVLLQGLTFGGFDVIDLAQLQRTLDRPILIVARKQPDMTRIEHALQRLGDAQERLRRFTDAGPMEPIAGVWVQRSGISAQDAEATLALHIRHGSFPEPLRVAHLLAAAHATGHSHGSA